MKCVCSPSVSFSSYTVITWMRLTARLFPSSALSLSLQVCDFMYNYLHNYSSLHPTVSGGLFLSLWYLLSFFFLKPDTSAHADITVLAPHRFCLPLAWWFNLSCHSLLSRLRLRQACSNIGKTAEQIQCARRSRWFTPGLPCFLINYSFRHHKLKEP